MAARLLLLALVASPAALEAAAVSANPIRKVVTMLQMMQNKVTAEGEKEKEIFDKYMCWCKTGASDLGKSIADANTKIPELQSDIEEAEGEMATLKADVEKHKADREAAVAAMKEATAIREKEAAAFEAETADVRSYLTALEKAVAALTAGVSTGKKALWEGGSPDGWSFAQTGTAAVLRNLLSKANLPEADKQDVLAFLSQGQGAPAGEYVPQSGEIIGILKQMHDEFAADLKDAIEKEEAAKKAYEELMAAKTKEKEALTKMIEEKLTRIANLGVKIAEMKNDLGDTEEGLVEDTKFLADLEKNCATKKKEWEVVCATRAEELLALADTIKILNDDDTLELFKKTLPSASFLQVQVTAASMRQRALAAILAARPAGGPGRLQLDFIALALHGKSAGFEKVLKMIDDMVAQLKQEQTDDESKKEYCDVQFDTSDDQKKELEHELEDLDTAIAKDEDAITATKGEIEALEDAIRALDKAVAEATETRKEEHEAHTTLMAEDSAAKEVILFAKNRLNKFYNPKLYKPPAKRELSEDERITLSMGGTLAPTAPPAGLAGTGIAVLTQQTKGAPPPPPEAVGAYKKKTEESGGVMAMIDTLVRDLDKEMTESTAEEKDAQEDYTAFMADSAAKRAEDSKSLTDKEAALADLEANLASLKENKASTEKEHAALLQYISSLHAECDWLLKYFEARKEARASEIDALGRAKAVLSGADYSLLQAKSSSTKKFLRGQ